MKQKKYFYNELTENHPEENITKLNQKRDFKMAGRDVQGKCGAVKDLNIFMLNMNVNKTYITGLSLKEQVLRQL